MIFREIADDVDLLCVALQCSPETLREIVRRPKLYRSAMVVPRRAGSARPRIVWAVDDPLRRIQRQFALWLKPHVDKQDPCVTAFRTLASPLRNAERHLGQESVVVADVADFYGTITLVDVAHVFEGLGSGRQVAITLARLATADERLMQGGRASPFLANLVGERLDRVVQQHLNKESTYTRYADDLTISGPKHAAPSEAEVRAWLKAARFRLREGSYSSKPAAEAYVTGLHIGGAAPKAPRHLRRKIERFFHFAHKFGIESAVQRTFLKGKRADSDGALTYVRGIAYWVRAIDPDLGNEWLQHIEEITSSSHSTEAAQQ